MSKKVPLPISIDEDLADWITKNSHDFEFRNRSHLVEQAILDFLKEHQ